MPVLMALDLQVLLLIIRRENNIKIYHREIGYMDGKSMELFQDCGQGWAMVLAVL
jgi:hypothetical protein